MDLIEMRELGCDRLENYWRDETAMIQGSGQWHQKKMDHGILCFERH